MNRNEKLRKYAKKEDFESNSFISDLINIIGFESTMDLILYYSGTQIYIPELRYFKPIIKRFLLDNKGKSLYKLSNELNVNVKTLKLWEKELIINKIQENELEKHTKLRNNILGDYCK